MSWNWPVTCIFALLQFLLIHYYNCLFFLLLKIGTHWKCYFICTWCSFDANFQFLQLGYVSKNEKNRFSSCCCYSVRPPHIRQISRSHFLKHNQDISLAYPSGMLLLTIFSEVRLRFIKINWKCENLIKFARGADVWNLPI